MIGAHVYLSRAKDAVALTRGYALLDQVLEHYSVASLVPFDAAAANTLNNFKRHKFRLSSMDLRIAAIAVSRGLILLTRNLSDFGQIPLLSIEDWTR
jgi:tRNA(fMet)-specific endonuclease VapC